MTTAFNALTDLDGGICLHSEAYKGAALAIFDNGSTYLQFTLLYRSQWDCGSAILHDTATANLDGAIAYARDRFDEFLRDILLPSAVEADLTKEDGLNRADQVRLMLRE